MFDQLFCRSDALTRRLSAPLVDERRQYLALCAAQGMSKCTMEVKARLLLSIAEYLRLAERPNDTIALPEIKKAASRWSRHNWPSPQSSHAKRSREYFTAQAAKWLTFLNRFRTPAKPATVYDQMLAEFRTFMEEDRGLSPATVKGSCSSVRPFLIQLLEGKRAATRTCRHREHRPYPCSLTHFANAVMCAASGPSSGRDRTTSSSMMNFMIGSFRPSTGPEGAKLCLLSVDYLP